jgi:alkylated DNA repair dioxygenase AlkB
MEDDAADPLEAFLAQFTLADPGQLLAAAAEFRPEDPAHAAAWADVRAVARAEGMEAEVDRLRHRVAQWATQGTGVTSGHLGPGPAEELLRTARAAAAGPIVDAGVVEMLGALLDPETVRVLVRPWGLADSVADRASDAGDSGPTDA